MGGHQAPPQRPGVSALGSSGARRGSSGAFRDTLIVAGLAVAGVVGMVVWSGGDVSTGAPSQDDPVVGGGEAEVIVAAAILATFPVPAGGVEQPADSGRTRSWFIAGKNWQIARDSYLMALAAQGITAEVESSIDQDGVVGERYVLSQPARSITVTMQIVDRGGQIVLELSA
jgi:hypothetical protein